MPAPKDGVLPTPPKCLLDNVQVARTLCSALGVEGAVVLLLAQGHSIVSACLTPELAQVSAPLLDLAAKTIRDLPDTPAGPAPRLEEIHVQVSNPFRFPDNMPMNG